jgi:lipoprotein-anchoring transpeptidase ErfK/SrfK
LRYRLVVRLKAQTVELFDGETSLAQWPAGVGTEEYPTPVGSFFVLEALRPADEGGPYGPLAYGLSAHSDVLSEFAGGDGRAAVHGTNQPSYLPGKVSHGCVRLRNEHIEFLADRIELGDPIDILP